MLTALARIKANHDGDASDGPVVTSSVVTAEDRAAKHADLDRLYPLVEADARERIHQMFDDSLDESLEHTAA